MGKEDKFSKLAKEIYNGTWNGIETIYKYRKFSQNDNAILLDSEVLTRKEFQELPEYKANKYQFAEQISIRYEEGSAKGVIEYKTYGEAVDCRKLFSKMFSDFIREYNIRKPFSLYKHLRFDGEDLSEICFQVWADKLVALRDNRLLGVFR